MLRRTILTASGSIVALSGCVSAPSGNEWSCGPGDLSAATVAASYDEYIERHEVFVGEITSTGDRPWVLIDDTTGTVLAAQVETTYESGTCVALSGTVVTVNGFQSAIDVVEGVPDADVYLIQGAITQV